MQGCHGHVKVRENENSFPCSAPRNDLNIEQNRKIHSTLEDKSVQRDRYKIFFSSAGKELFFSCSEERANTR